MDVVIDVPPESQIHRQVIRKRADVDAIAVDPVVRLYYVTVPEPDLASPSGDLERLRAALVDQWGLTVATVHSSVLGTVQSALRDGQWAVTVALRHDKALVGVFPGFRDRILGVGFDVGSTTLAGHLCDLTSGAILASAGRMNPQIAFGEDLMSRVSYVMLNPGGRAILTARVREAMNDLIGDLCTDADTARQDIIELTFVGNPIMHHLVLGIDPTPLGTAPFALATDEAVETGATELGLSVHPGATVYALPCIAGHVGADAAAMTLSEGPHRGEAVTLLVDIGTNAEIILGNRHRLMAASSPTGPAFEGAAISSGQRATPGAIERVRVDPDTKEPRFTVIGSEVWSDDPGFADSVHSTGVTGICGSGIIEAVAEMYLAGVLSSDGVIAEDPAAARVVGNGRTFSYRLWDDPIVEVTQNDVRAVQLAKAALHAGCVLLMERLGVREVDSIRLAGAFGSHIDPMHALVLGLVPDIDPTRVSAAGNAAGTGALMALLSGVSRREVESVARTIEKIETATEPAFQEHFVAAMSIPHAKDPYRRLGAMVTLPAPRITRTRDRRRRTADQETT